jgi:hypothetical protein
MCKQKFMAMTTLPLNSIDEVRGLVVDLETNKEFRRTVVRIYLYLDYFNLIHFFKYAEFPSLKSLCFSFFQGNCFEAEVGALVSR